MSHMDSDLRGLLLELAADSDSTLLRPTSRQVRRVTSDSRPILSRADATLAERKLLEHYPVRVARLLHSASEELAIEQFNGRRLTCDLRADGSPVERRGVRTLSGRATKLTQHAATTRLDDESREFLMLLARSGSFPTPDQLATAALRLEPSDDHRIRLGYNALLRKRNQEAVTRLRWVLDNNGLRAQRIRALHGIAAASMEAAGPRSARRVSAEVRSLDASFSLAIAAELVCSAMLEDRVGVQDSAARLDDALPTGSGALAAITRTYRRQRPSIQSKLTLVGLKALRNLRQSSDGAAAQIAGTLS